MDGFFKYFWSTLDPMSNIGFSRAIPDLMWSALLSWWLLVVLPFVLGVLPAIVVWVIYFFRRSWISPTLPAIPPRRRLWFRS